VRGAFAQPPAVRWLRVLVVLLFSVFASILVWVTRRSASSVDEAAASTPHIRIVHTNATPPVATIEVGGLTFDFLSPFRVRTPTADEWQKILRVTVVSDTSDTGLPAVAGTYALGDHEIVFTPLFGLDPGRRYSVALDQGGGRRLTQIVNLPKPDIAPSTIVDHLYPSGDAVPENLLRLYVHFSAPMGRKGGLDYIRLLDADGRPVIDPFLPLDAEFWNGDRTRFTVFLDPGRVKRGVLPNEQMGRSLTAGQRYTLVVSRDWLDAQGLPLKEEFRRTFRVEPPDSRPLDPAAWRVQAPGAGSREPVTVTFPEPLDHGLLLRAMGVAVADGATAGAPVAGESAVDENETRWRFTPREPWRAGGYRIVVMTILEDVAGNRIGRAFEVDRFDRVDKGDAETISLPVQVR
jgi:hypothetical protein